MRIDVFIPVFNDIRSLPAAVDSALAQTGVDLRVVVSDNASTDGTSDWLAEAARRDNRIVVHRNARNIGLVGNLNRYRDLVEAPYYMLLCSDDVLFRSNALAKAAAVATAHPDAVNVYCDLAYIDAKGMHVASRRFGRKGPFSAEHALKTSINTYRNLFGIPLLGRTDVMKRLSYPDGLTYTGDVHLSMQAARYGTLHHIPEILIGNRYTGGNMTASVLNESHAQFLRLAQEFGVRLSGLDHMRRAASFPLVMLGKRAFLAYMRMRARRLA